MGIKYTNYLSFKIKYLDLMTAGHLNGIKLELSLILVLKFHLLKVKMLKTVKIMNQ